MGFWDRLKKDIKKGIDEGLEALKESTEVIKSRAEHVTDDIKKKVKVFELKQKIQAQLTELGGLVYDLQGDKRKNPLRDEKVQKVLTKINKLEEQVKKIEGTIKEATKKVKTRAKKKTASKTKSTRKTVKSGTKKTTRKTTKSTGK